MIFTVQTLLTLHPKTFVSTANANRQTHRRETREDIVAPTSKYEILFGHGRWAGLRGSGKPKPLHEIHISGANECSDKKIPPIGGGNSSEKREKKESGASGNTS